MTTVLNKAEHCLLEPVGLISSDLQNVLSSMLGGQIEAADLYFQNMQQEALTLEEGIIKNGSSHISQGVGLRAMSGEKTGFAYCDDMNLSALQQSAFAARGIAYRGEGSIEIKSASQALVVPAIYTDSNPLYSLSSIEKINLLKQVEAEAKKQDPRVIQVVASLSASFETILIMNSEGVYSADIRPLVRLGVNVIVADAKGNRESGSSGGGGRTDYHYFLDNNSDKALGYARNAVRQAVMNLEAKPAPAGMLPVVLGPGWPGVLLHEAVGHGLEGDFNRKKSSVFSGRVGEKVAHSLCTVVDDGTILNRRGSLTIDDEGMPTQRTVLIEKGILKGYMQDKLNARLMKVAPTGNGRRESYAHKTLPRMTNTFMLPGPHSPEEIIHSVKRGIYAVNFGGGSVDITSGNFVFSANEAYLIENGKIMHPVKGATLIGNGPDVMHKISMVGNDLALDSGVGVCGKDGQSVPVGVGQPTLLVDEMTVGGTQ